VQRSKQTGATGPEDQNIGLETLEGHAILRTCAPAR
jgi:hypothetical protein